MRRLHPRDGRQRGAALLFVIGLVVLLMAILSGLQYEVVRTLNSVQNTRTLLEAQKMAETGISAAMILLKYDHEEDTRNNTPVDYYFKIDLGDGLEALEALSNINEIWSLFLPGGMSALAALGMGSNLFPIGDEGGVEVSLEDESGKWNVHRIRWPRVIKADDNNFKAALNGFTYLTDSEDEARTIVWSLVDWMDSNAVQQDGAGAESFYYQSLDNPYRARNGDFQHVDELRAVRGIDEAVFAAAQSAVTVWPNRQKYSYYKINVNTASADALLFLHPDLDITAAEDIVLARDDEHFATAADFRNYIIKELGLKKIGNEMMTMANFSVQSNTFRVRSTGYFRDRRASLEAVIQRLRTGQMKILHRRWVTL